MITYLYPTKEEWNNLATRPVHDNNELGGVVSTILEDVKTRGDKSLFELTEKFDKVKLDTLLVSEAEFAEAEMLVDKNLKLAINQAKRNISYFHESQLKDIDVVTTTKGVECWQKRVPIERVGLYIPGGTAPLFSTVLMTALPAYISGCSTIILCTPPNKEGKIHPAILYAARQSGVTAVYKVGGAQSIAAMSYGTESIPKVYKIFGPGNQYVTKAKQIVSMGDVAIDMPAGPSEVLVMADETGNASFIASDLLSQAEHGIDSQSIFVTNSEPLLIEVKKEVSRQLESLSRKEIAIEALKNCRLIVMKDMEEVVNFTNYYAPEHLIIMAKNEDALADCIINAGSVFIGQYSPESAGDYASGTNHTLPTNGYAKMYSGINTDSFNKKITYQKLTREGLLTIGNTIEIMANNEGLDAHAKAVSIRLDYDVRTQKDEDIEHFRR